MAEIDPKIAELEARLDSLVRTQIDFQQEITTIRRELTKLRGGPPPLVTRQLTEPPPPRYVSPTEPRRPPPNRTADVPPPTFGMKPDAGKSESSAPHESAFSKKAEVYKESARSDLEKFIGENLISKIGIIILVLGVAIGAKYAIDNGWISPLMRIVFGYVMGFGLLGFAVRLKAKYLNFSSVLLSGGMAIMYFVTYFAYAYYGLMPQVAAFILMAMFTAFTVAAAIFYNRQVIAHIGLVGTYAVPFLLSDNSGNYLFLFAYMSIINGGILAISVKKYWRSLYYTAFGFTWLIFGSWFLDKYNADQHFYLAVVFASIFFAIFYLVALVYRLVTDKISVIENAGLVLVNSFAFYGFTYAIVDSRQALYGYLGLLTGGHALLHSLVAQTVSRFKASAVDVVQVLTILIITFATIAIPVQFDGNAITLFWAVEAAALFWYGRARLIPLFEYFSYPLMLLASCSLLVDWIRVYTERTYEVSPLNRYPILNGDLVTGLVFVAAFAFIYLVNRRKNADAAIDSTEVRLFGMAVASVALFALYNVFRMEIGNYFHLQLVGSEAVSELSSLLEPMLIRRVDDIVRFNAIWQLNYTMFFLAAVAAVNRRRARSITLGFVGIGLSILALLIFVSDGMYLFYELRLVYLSRGLADGYVAGPMNVVIRYISYLFAAGLLTSMFLTARSKMIVDAVSAEIRELGWDTVLYLTIFITASCELINLMEQVHIADADRLGLSILWGVYALFLIVLGIAWNKKHLRITAFVLLAVTLVKLFIYDVADLPTIPKTILFVSLGLLLLVVSFLYNKYKAIIFKTGEEPVE